MNDVDEPFYGFLLSARRDRDREGLVGACHFADVPNVDYRLEFPSGGG